MKETTIENFEEEVLDAKGHRLIYFYSDNCLLCINLKRIMQRLEGEFSNIKFFKVNVDRNKELAAIFINDGVPTLYYCSEKSMEEVPYPYDNPSNKTGYREIKLKKYLTNKVLNG